MPLVDSERVAVGQECVTESGLYEHPTLLGELARELDDLGEVVLEVCGGVGEKHLPVWVEDLGTLPPYAIPER